MIHCPPATSTVTSSTTALFTNASSTHSQRRPHIHRDKHTHLHSSNPTSFSMVGGSTFAGRSFYLDLITFGHCHRMASVDRDNTHWGRIGVRLTGSIQWTRHNHLELADLTPKPRAGPAQSANTTPPLTPLLR